MNNYRARPLLFGLPCAVLCGMAWGQGGAPVQGAAPLQGVASVSLGQAQATPPPMQVQTKVQLPPDTRRQDLRSMVSQQHNGASAMAVSLAPDGLDSNAKHLSLDERTQLRRQLTPEQRPGNTKP